ncbi:type I DNA topoisomerase [Deinococcus psychrotolerans]|uniref:DNA topoisomerase 1 n=1 Tax=Deinococcus psychrotolerans TaxID=2489213 RepID=A0A3G8Y9P8_9DEIO|nr:type I DNA topoisomerase [Deinococcus psychrotolerans]AZI42089.1 type I DNA topoisomerase [Deinococcus psychrotolerans]
MSNTLIIVESPAKAKTIAKYLGKGYTVESSIGHIRDLPKSAAEIPEKYKGQAWARLGLDIEDDFRPLYIVSPDKRAHVAYLRKLAQQADEVILATDDDREGESIAWHLYQELKPKGVVKRMVFHEITKAAIEAAIANPRQIDSNLVEAQETRRALDRLYGYEVSPVLWRKVAPKLSAGRVQSVATRMLVERERERMRFVESQWWDIEVGCVTADGEGFPARLLEVGGVRLAQGRDFDPLTGKLKPDAQVLRLDEETARALANSLKEQALKVLSAEEKPFSQKPYAPFITSTLQQEGSRKLGFGAQRTMRAAQKLYEGGYITYMRTDSTTLSGEAISAARAQVKALYGDAYLPAQPRSYTKKAKNAQEAHEAIRPAGTAFRTPDSLKTELGSDEWKMYDLIWKRTVASQMADARGRRMQVRLGGQTQGGQAQDAREVLLSASGRSIDFPGFLRAYVEGRDDPQAALEDRETILPPLKEGQQVTAADPVPSGHQTQPPARYTEASLVQSLEGAGIGRPSTYASIIGTIQDRGYAAKKGQALVPTWTAFATSALLEHHFGTLVDYDFTAKMEEDLDDIAGGRQQRGPYLRSFFLGEGGGMGLRPLIETQMETIDPRSIATIAVPKLEGSGIEVRVGKYGPYLTRGETKANIPEDLTPDDLDMAKAEELLSRPSGDRIIGEDPGTGLAVVAKAGRFGPYVQIGEENPPVRTASLFPSDDLATLGLDRALKLLSLPRMVGVSEGEEIWAHNGKFGPYLKRGNDSRSLAIPEQLFTTSMIEAEALFMQPRFKGGRGASAAPLASFEFPDRAPITLKSGRFGPYLTDGERNATLRKGEDQSSLNAVDARNILEERGKEPKKKEAKGRRTATKASGKAAAKPATKKAAPKKPAAKKPAASKTAASAAAKPKSQPMTWAQLRPHLSVLSDQERALVTATRERGEKVEAVAPELGLDVKKAKGMALQASKKLNQAARESGAPTGH